MDPELIAYLDERFRGIDERFRETAQQIQELRQDSTRRFERLEKAVQQNTKDIQRLTRVVQQNTKDIRQNTKDIRRNEEAIRHTGVTVEHLRSEIRLVADGVAAGNQKLESFREEVAQELSAVRGLIRQSYGDLDRRIQKLEARGKGKPGSHPA